MWLVFAQHTPRCDFCIYKIQSQASALWEKDLTLLTYCPGGQIHHSCYIGMQAAKAVAATAPGWESGRGESQLICVGWVSGRSGITEKKSVICNVQQNKIIIHEGCYTDRHSYEEHMKTRCAVLEMLNLARAVFCSFWLLSKQEEYLLAKI